MSTMIISGSRGTDDPTMASLPFITRLLKVTKTDGEVVTGRIASNTDADVTLTVAVKKEAKEVVVALADIKRAVVEIEFNRKDEN